MAKDKKESSEALEVKEENFEKKESGKHGEKQLVVMAQDYFKRVKANDLHATEDGQFFYKMSDARNHASNKKLAKPITLKRK